MPKVIIRGRSTGRGAYTTAGGKRVNVSRTGNHWDEIVIGPVGHEFVITDITNSGKHQCSKVRITGENKYETVDVGDDYECPFCEA